MREMLSSYSDLAGSLGIPFCSRIQCIKIISTLIYISKELLSLQVLSSELKWLIWALGASHSKSVQNINRVNSLN